jgi:hypothetical protein
LARRAAWLVAWLLLAVAPAVGAETAEPALPEGEASAPPVELERLLTLPSSLDYSLQTRGGQTPGEWRARFRRLREALDEERAALARAERRLDEVASSADAWTLAPPLPGATPGEAPLDFELRQEIRRRRGEIERIERRMRELQVEANLAGVPEAWRE